MSLRIHVVLAAEASDRWVALAKAADLAGVSGVLVPYDPDGPESLVAAAGLLRATRYLEVYAGIEPWIATPQYTAKLSASLQRFSGGRFGWHVQGEGAVDFAAAAEEFWERRDGLDDVLSEYPFPRVVTELVRLDPRGREPRETAAALEEHERAGVTDVFLEVGDDVGAVYRLGEHVLPLLATYKEPDYVR